MDTSLMAINLYLMVELKLKTRNFHSKGSLHLNQSVLSIRHQGAQLLHQRARLRHQGVDSLWHQGVDSMWHHGLDSLMWYQGVDSLCLLGVLQL